jgi:hypothetical protein
VGQPLKSCGGSKEDEHSNRPKQNKMILPLMQGKRDKRRNNDRKAFVHLFGFNCDSQSFEDADADHATEMLPRLV